MQPSSTYLQSNVDVVMPTLNAPLHSRMLILPVQLPAISEYRLLPIGVELSV